jgi:hypothetical protein
VAALAAVEGLLEARRHAAERRGDRAALERPPLLEEKRCDDG